HQTIITVEKIVMVALDENGIPVAHGKTQMEYAKDRLNNGQ
ncbi:MAG: acyl-CoA thioesterase, partial [Chryseobacterium sp.]|nr:acyl-CoA thioesterase [Chryseobacterium sp.]